MGIITYWLLGLFLSLIVVAGLYDYWQQRRVERSLPPEMTKAGRRQARRVARAGGAHVEDTAKQPPPPSVF
ncbi:MAG TPA: hypothetical protein VES60_11245 [Nakamurella sp.]|nr:hypothetical protein [Nakamurella sp.]